MIGLDTNILVRYFTLDDPIQSSRAVRLIEQQLSPEAPGYISAVVMVELVWVLTRSLRWDRLAISEVVQSMIEADHFALEHEAEVLEAMFALRETSADFADALIGAIAAEAGCVRTLTFDRRAAQLPGFDLA